MTEEIIKEEFDKAFNKHFPDAIIIDGVNVAGCYHFSVFGSGMCGLSECGGRCKDFNNCLYKQLKRLEQERDELKQEYKQAHEDFICSDTALRIANTELDELKQENKRLKETVKSRENELANMTEQANMRINNYRSALETIREIAVDIYTNDVYENSDIKAGKIIRKIDEVLKTQNKINEVLG